MFSFLFFGVIVLRNGAERKKYFSFFLYPSFHISIRDKVDWLCRFFLNPCLALSRFPGMLRKSGLLESWSVLWTATNGVLSVNLTCSCACGTCDSLLHQGSFYLTQRKPLTLLRNKSRLFLNCILLSLSSDNFMLLGVSWLKASKSRWPKTRSVCCAKRLRTNSV